MDSLHKKSSISVDLLLRLERCGKYDDAISLLDGVWLDKEAFPDVDGLGRREAAEILLRCGSIIGFLGYNIQTPNSQEQSKNLLTEAHQRFFEIYDVEKIAECENYLALAYWRSGEITEAETWINEALSRDLSESSFVRLYSVITKSGNLLTNGMYQDVVSLLSRERNACLEYGDDCLKGDFYNHFALALKNKGSLTRALEYFHLGKFYHQKSGHVTYLAAIENNIASVCNLQGNFEAAHRAIDRSLEIFKKIKVEERYGFSLDTKAIIYLNEGKLEEALETVDDAISVLRKGENFDFLVETFSTKIRVLIRHNRIDEAALCLSEAVDIARVRLSEAKAMKLAEGFANAINDQRTPVVVKTYTEKELKDESIELVFPPELSHHKEIQGVWIKNRHLENSGIAKGSLAIIAIEEIRRGDLAAILEDNEGEVSCGFFDSDFGVISLQADDNEPRLFNEDDVKILGKVIGVARKSTRSENKMFVEPITISR